MNCLELITLFDVTENDTTNPLGQKKSPEDLFWGAYLTATDKEEKVLADEWNENAGSLLTFVRDTLC